MPAGRKLLWLFIFCTIHYYAMVRLFPPELYRLWVLFKVDALLLILGLVLNKDKALSRCFFGGVVGIWGVWTAYTFINWLAIGLNPTDLSPLNKFWALMRIYSFMAVIYYEASIDFSGSLKRLLIVFSIYSFVGLFLQESELITTGHNEGRYSTSLGNHFPLAMCCFAFVSIFANVRNVISRKTLFIILVVVMFIIFRSATRKCLGALVILISFYILHNTQFKSSRKIILLIISSVAIGVAYDYILENTLIGQRMKTIDDQASETEIPVYLYFLGDRASHYVIAWDMFLQHPINGVGTKNFMHVSYLGMPPHSEYMTQLSEGGLLGTSIFIYYLFNIGKLLFNGFRYRVAEHKDIIISLSGVIMLLFLGLTTWTYDGPHFFVVWALVTAYCNPIQSVKSKLIGR